MEVYDLMNPIGSDIRPCVIHEIKNLISNVKARVD